ncbi:MAG: hypothetical protein FJ146_07060 [Deltaproteobacteria bacterium]|nr:hypothetical protein [Deltaproteobacteria bacterium]
MKHQGIMLVASIAVILALGCRSTGKDSSFKDGGEFNLAIEKDKLRKAIDLIVKEEERLALTIKNYPPRSEDDISGSFRTYQDQMNALAETSLFYPDDTDRGAAFKEVWQSYPIQVRDTLLLHSLEYGSSPGDKIYLSAILANPFNYDVYFTEDDLLNAARRLGGVLNGVSWNGSTERFDYADPKTKLDVLILASKLSTDTLSTINLLERNNLITPLRVNRHTADPATRAELFDLVQGQLTANVFHRILGSEGNRIAVTKAVHRKLYKDLKMTPQLDDRASDYQDIYVTSVPGRESQRQLLTACTNLRVEGNEGTTSVYPSTAYISFGELSLLNLYPQQPLKITCDDDTYTFAIEKLKAEALSLPPEYDIRNYSNNGEINVLLTYAFSNETDAKLLSGIVTYLATKGFFMNPATDIKRGVPTLDAFKAAFNESDIYIPAAHLLDLNTFELGTDKSTVMTFTKKFKHKSGVTLRAKVTGFFPEKNSGQTKRLNRADLAQLLAARRTVNPDSLFVLTTSCRATDAISTWTSAYRQSLELDIAAGKLKEVGQAKDLIHAIAPEGSFPTGSPSELLLDFIGPIESLKIIFEGGKPEDVYVYLQKPINPDRFVKFIQRVERLVSGRKGHIEPVHFFPKYNLSEKELLDQKGFDYKLTKVSPTPAN